MKLAFAEHAFRRNLADIRCLLATINSLGEPERSTGLRSVLLLAVSSFDFLMHELVRVQIFHKISDGQSDLNLDVPFKAVQNDSRQFAQSVDLKIRRDNSFRSFVSSSNIKEAFKPIYSDVWRVVADATNLNVTETKDRLDIIWRWRNRIAHEADLVASFGTFTYWPIFFTDVEEAVDEIEKVGLCFVNAIDVT